jgi:hypothetical protein
MTRTSLRRAVTVLALLLAAPALLGAADEGPGFNQRVLASHNQERAALGLAPLRWNPQLARAAGTWAEQLASSGRFEHSPEVPRLRVGENLWGGTAGRFAPEQMVGLWLEEKRYFKPGVFPANSTSGNAHDVGHYTQVIWRRTTEVGCSLARGEQEDILVCRYAQAGNVRGQSPL